MKRTYIRFQGKAATNGETVHELPHVNRFESNRYEEFEEDQSSKISFEYRDSAGSRNCLGMSLAEGLHLLSMLKSLQLDIGVLFPDDPREVPRPFDSARFKGDPWIQQNSPIEPEKLHAIGLVVLRWNSCELGLTLLFRIVAGLSFPGVWPIADKLGDVSLCSIIREIVLKPEFKIPMPNPDPVVNALIIGIIEAYDVNRLNRNQLIHFLPSGSFDDGMELTRQKGSLFDPQPFQSSLKDVRRVAKEIEALSHCLSALMNCLSERRRRPIAKTPSSWPEKPPIPERLWTPSAANRQKPRSRPRP